MFRPMRRFKQALSEEECRKVLQEEKRGTLALAGEGHKIDALRRCDKVSFNVHDDGVIQLGDWAYTVRSVTLFGRLHIMEEHGKAMALLRQIGLKYYPTAESVDKIMASSASRVTMLELVPEHMTGKLVHEK